MSLSFSEIWSAIPRTERTNRTKVSVALLALDAVRPETATPVAKITALLKLKLRSGCPTNVADALRKAEPHAEAHGSGHRSLLWWLTPVGLSYLERVTSLLLRATGPAVASYGLASLHPAVRAVAEPLFLTCHYAEAIGRASKQLNLLVRQRTNRTSDEGVRMMMQVFSPDPNGQSRLVLGSVAQAWERDRQEGFRFLMAGLQQGIANVDKHGHLSIPDANAAVELLAFVSFLARQIDSATIAV